MAKVDPSGVFFHAKHAFMPNKLGYCGPDDRGRILQHLQESSVDDMFLSLLKKFEAAYPFVRLIANSSGKDPFDPKVTEAYWIGNMLLSNVSSRDFYNFTLANLKKKNSEEIKKMFLDLRDRALPHHTFYVISAALDVISDSHYSTKANSVKISETIDNCRISWGQVLKVEEDHLWVKYKPVVLVGGKMASGPDTIKKDVEYDPAIPPFGSISPRDYVSMHWNSACEVLSRTQVHNITKYTKKDIDSTNLFLRASKKRI